MARIGSLVVVSLCAAGLAPALCAAPGDEEYVSAVQMLVTRHQAAAQATMAVASGVKVTSRTARVVRLDGEEPVALESRFYAGPGPSPSAKCTTAAVTFSGDHPEMQMKLTNGFAASAGGAMWAFSAVILTGCPPSDWAEADEVKLILGVRTENAGWTTSAFSLNVAGADDSTLEEVPLDFHEAGTPVKCPPPYCLMPKPSGPEIPDRVSTPECGFGEAPIAVVSRPGPPAGEEEQVEFDITALAKQGFTSFRVWSTPSQLSSQGFWEVSRVIINSWTFSTSTSTAWSSLPKASNSG